MSTAQSDPWAGYTAYLDQVIRGCAAQTHPTRQDLYRVTVIRDAAERYADALNGYCRANYPEEDTLFGKPLEWWSGLAARAHDMLLSWEVEGAIR